MKGEVSLLIEPTCSLSWQRSQWSQNAGEPMCLILFLFVHFTQRQTLRRCAALWKISLARLRQRKKSISVRSMTSVVKELVYRQNQVRCIHVFWCRYFERRRYEVQKGRNCHPMEKLHIHLLLEWNHSTLENRGGKVLPSPCQYPPAIRRSRTMTWMNWELRLFAFL